MANMDAVAPKVRAQLESIAESDPNRLNRMVATRALSGDAKWNEYVVASLKDAALADAERLEGFAYLGGTGAQINVNNPLLDDAAITVLRAGNGLSASSPVRGAMLVPLMMNKGADPAVRQAVEELATSDPDPLMRRRAGQVLQVTDQLAKDGRPLMFLQSSPLIESATPVQ
jgi:hypothetical protein